MSKDFKDDNPAMAFISVPEQGKEEEELSKNSPPSGYKLNPKYIETRSKRLGLLMQPSIFDRLKEIADENHTSVNEVANEAIKRYVLTCGKSLPFEN